MEYLYGFLQRYSLHLRQTNSVLSYETSRLVYDKIYMRLLFFVIIILNNVQFTNNYIAPLFIRLKHNLFIKCVNLADALQSLQLQLSFVYEVWNVKKLHLTARLDSATVFRATLIFLKALVNFVWPNIVKKKTFN